jgi:hypothetical protein
MPGSSKNSAPDPQKTGPFTLTKSLSTWCAVSLVVAAILVAGTGFMFSSFQQYDDEGYMHYSINSFAANGGLYRNMDSQYGPFFHVVHDLLHTMGVPFTTDGGRLLMLSYWLVTVGFCGAITWRLARCWAATVLVLAASFAHLGHFTNEPTHPGGMAAMLLVLLAWLGASWPDRPKLLAASAGAIGAALIFTKINVGLFVVAGAGAWWLLHLNRGRLWPHASAVIAGILLVAMPFGLMAVNLEKTWALIFAFVAASAVIGVLFVAARATQQLCSLRDLVAFTLAAALVTALSIAGIMARDTSLSEILDRVLIAPLRHPDLFTIPVTWLPGAPIMAAGSTALAIWAAFRHDSRAVLCAVASGRLLALAIYVTIWAMSVWKGTATEEMGAFLLSHGVAFTWLFVFPLTHDSSPLGARAWLAFLLVTQMLQVYPVAGSQIGWGTFLWIPLAVGSAPGAMRTLKFNRMAGTIQLSALARIAAVGLSLWIVGTMARYGRNLLRNGSPLGLPGATWVRLPSIQASTLRTLTLNASLHGDMLFSFPGQLSFNHWSGVPTPTRHNNTHWFTLLDPERQQEIRATLERSPRSAVIFQHDELATLSQRGTATENALSLWLRAAYEPAFRLGAYEFRVRQGRRIAPIGTALVREDGGRHSVSAILALSSDKTIAAAELHRFKGLVTEKIAGWQLTDARLTPIDDTGSATSPGSELIRVEFTPGDFPSGVEISDTILYFLDESGRRVAEARPVS